MRIDPVAGMVTVQAGTPDECQAVADYLRSLEGFCFDAGGMLEVPAAADHGVVWRQKLFIAVPGLVSVADKRRAGLYLLPL